MTVLVTGATGFLGSHLVDELLGRGSQVRVLLRQAADAAALESRGVEVAVGDLRQAEAVRSASAGIQTIYHCGALTGGGRSAAELYAVNLGGVRNILEAAAREPAATVVLLSSINVYGMRNLVRATEDTPLRRSHDPAADVKIEAERLAAEFSGRGLDVRILRPGVIYGPRDRHNLTRLADAVRRGKFRYIGSRRNLVPIVHVSDVVQLLIALASKSEAKGRVYHCSDDSETTIEQLVTRLAELQGVPPPARRVPYWLPAGLARLVQGANVLTRRDWKPPVNLPTLRFLGTSRSLDNGRARSELGYRPKIGYMEGLSRIPWETPEEHAPDVRELQYQHDSTPRPRP